MQKVLPREFRYRSALERALNSASASRSRFFYVLAMPCALPARGVAEGLLRRVSETPTPSKELPPRFAQNPLPKGVYGAAQLASKPTVDLPYRTARMTPRTMIGEVSRGRPG